MTVPSFQLPDDRDKLADLGRLAGALAHELKNPLGVVLMNADLMLTQRPEGISDPGWTKLQARLERIRRSAQSLHGIVASFLAYARPSRPLPEAVDVNHLLKDLIDELRASFTAVGITATFHGDDGLCLLPADRGQLRSVFLNIILNAIDALRERAPDRRLLIVTRAAPDAVRVVIANNGPPLPDAIAGKMFEPFVTTKEHGTGLGLAIVHRLVENHRGTISVASDVNQGVSFTIEFPTPLGLAKPWAKLPMPSATVAAVRSEPSRPRRRSRARSSTPTSAQVEKLNPKLKPRSGRGHAHPEADA